MDGYDSDDSIEQRKKRREEQKKKDEQDSDDVGSNYTDEQDLDSEEEQRRWEEKEAEEIRQHQLAMAKREGLMQAKKKKQLTGINDPSVKDKPFRSSKGFLSLRSEIEKQEEEQRAATKKDEGETCPYNNCGRSFISQAQLTAHIERRHKAEAPSPKMDEPSKETPVPEKSKAKAIIEQSKKGHTFAAKPNVRPATSWGAGKGLQGEPASKNQQELLADIMKGSAQALAIRPQTAATSTLQDETRILSKLKYLEKIEMKIEEDLEEFVQRRGDKEKKERKGVRLSRDLIMSSGQCDTLTEVQTLFLREKNIEVFDEPPPTSAGAFKFDEMINLECIYASHNLVRDVFGISQITQLKELNLSFNLIQDIGPLETLVQLQKLFINRNKISVIEPLRKLTRLQVVGLFHNEIFNSEKSLEVLVNLGRKYCLKEISIDGNPITSTTRFKNQLLVSIPSLEVLDDEKIQPLDLEVANQYFEMHNLPRPSFSTEKSEGVFNQTEVRTSASRKKVKFDSIDDDHEGDWQQGEIKRLQDQVAGLVLENSDLKKKLEKKNYDQVYRENKRLQLELKNMYIIEEENKDLQEDLKRLKGISYDTKVKQMAEENDTLRKRNGFLLIEHEQMERKCKEAEEKLKQAEHLPMSAATTAGLARPQTAGGAFGRKKEDAQMLDDEDFLKMNATDVFDKELAALIERNQKIFNEAHSEMKEVSKRFGETTINVRKLPSSKQVLGQSTAVNVDNQENVDAGQIDSTKRRV